MTRLARAAALVDDYLLAWVLAAIAAGGLAPDLAALVAAAGFPPLASLPAVVFGAVEMATSAGLARWFAGR